MKRVDRGKFITSPRASEEPVKVKEEKSLITVVLLSENHGHRMKSYGPVSLLKVSGKTLLDRQIDAIYTSIPNAEIVICCGFDTYKTVNFVRSHFKGSKIRVVENQLHYNTNCCESTRLCLNNVMNDKVLFCHGGILLRPEHIAAVDFKKTCVVMQDNNNDTNLEIGIIENNSILENMGYGIKHKYWSEIFYISGQNQINEFYGLISNADYKNKLLFEAINDFSRRFQVGVVRMDSNVTKIDNIKTIKGMK